MVSAATSFWEEIADLYRWGMGDLTLLQGQHACFCLDITNHAVECDDSFLVKAYINQRAQVHCSGHMVSRNANSPATIAPSKVLIRASKKDFNLILRHSSRVRLVQALVELKDGQVILDAIATPSFFAGHRDVRRDECVVLAEVFAGGFGGWSRASALLRQAGVQTRVGWCIEKDEVCVKPLQFADEGILVVEPSDDVEYDMAQQSTYLFCTDFHETWWRPHAAKQQAQVFCISPPCQPWSKAGLEAGLASKDGLLLLHVVDLVKAFAPPVVIFEEVEQFMRHAHFRVFRNAMEQADYFCVWQASLNLAEVAPTVRRRFFMIWLHNEHRSWAPQFQDSRWQAQGFPSLAAADAVFRVLPQALLDPCMLPEPIMQLYLDPQLLPPSRTGQHVRPPRDIRVIQPTHQAGTIMAQYHYQHLLPMPLLKSKGLMGCLLQAPQGVRFLSTPEVASAHGVCHCILLLNNDRDMMRILGNGLAVQHAIFVLSMALQLVPDLQLEPPACVNLCHEQRLTASTSLLLEVQDGWIMCHPSHAAKMQCQQSLRAQLEQGFRIAPPAFQKICVVAGTGSLAQHLVLHVSHHLDVAAVIQSLGLADDRQLPGDAMYACKVDASQPMQVSLTSWSSLNASDPSLHVLAEGQHFFLRKRTPDAWVQLYQVFASLPLDCGTAACFDLAGTRLRSLAEMPSVVIATVIHEHVCQEAPSFAAQCLEGCRPMPEVDSFTVEVSGSVAVDWWFASPKHLARAFAVDVLHSQFPPPGDTNFLLTFSPGSSEPQFDRLQLQLWLRNLFFLAPIRDASQTAAILATSDRVFIEVQVVAQTLWQGYVPGALLPEHFSGWWKSACAAFGLAPDVRVYSGPFPLDLYKPLAAWSRTSDASHLVRKRTGALLVSMMPPVFGGGAKDDKSSNAQTKVAQACLANGSTVNDAQRISQLLSSTWVKISLPLLLRHPRPPPYGGKSRMPCRSKVLRLLPLRLQLLELPNVLAVRFVKGRCFSRCQRRTLSALLAVSSPTTTAPLPVYCSL